jgi:hypothetical protein
MMTRTYANCLLSFPLLKCEYSWAFLAQITPFFFLFSVTLVTIHKVTFNKINDLCGGGLQVEIGGQFCNAL